MNKISGISVEIERIVLEKLDAFNEGKASDKERYYLVAPTEKTVYYTLWFYSSAAVYHPFVFLDRLELNLLNSLDKAMKIVANSCYPLTVTPATGRTAESSCDHGDDLITFGKYRGHTLQEIFTIDPRYVAWLADKYEPRVKNEFRFKELATVYHRVYIDLHTPRKYKVAAGKNAPAPGEKLTDLLLTIVRVRTEDDPYKTRFVSGTANFYVDQLITAVDSNENLYSFTVKASGRSLQSRTLNAADHAYRPGEKLVIASAKILRYFRSNNNRYIRLGYIRFKDGAAGKKRG